MQRKSLEASIRIDRMVFSPAKRGRGRSSSRALEEIVRRDLMINDIPGNLVFNGIVQSM